MYTDASTESNTDAEQLPATDRVYAALRSAIRAGHVAPWDRLTEKSVASEFGVSRTPVRESIARLVAEGLLQKHGNGFGLVLPSPDTLGGLYEARLALELQGIRRVAQGSAEYDTTQLSALYDQWRELRAEPPEPAPHLVALDEAFHCGALAAAGEPALVSVLIHINDRIRALRMYGYTTSDRLATAAEQHLEIMDLLFLRDYATAEIALTEHIITSRHAALARALHKKPANGFTGTVPTDAFVF